MFTFLSSQFLLKITLEVFEFVIFPIISCQQGICVSFSVFCLTSRSRNNSCSPIFRILGPIRVSYTHSCRVYNAFVGLCPNMHVLYTCQDQLGFRQSLHKIFFPLGYENFTISVRTQAPPCGLLQQSTMFGSLTNSHIWAGIFIIHILHNANIVY